MTKRRTRRRRLAGTQTILILGLMGTVAGLILPWAEVDPAAYGIVQDTLSDLGLIPQAGRPVRGYEIPWRIREETGRAGVAATLITRDLARGRMDRAAARALFGERIEVAWAPIVLLPAALGMLQVLLALTLKRPATLVWSWLALIDLIATGAFALGYVRALRTDTGPPLIIHAGVPLTLIALALISLAALRRSRP